MSAPAHCVVSHTHTHVAVPLWLVSPQQATNDGDGGESKGNRNTFYLWSLHVCSAGQTRFHVSDEEKPPQGPKHVWLLLIPLLSPFASCSSVILPWNHTHTHSHSKNPWPCILHESSTSEGLRTSFHFGTYSSVDAVEAVCFSCCLKHHYVIY